MPSGPKKRARARRKKAGSPSVTTDANSDRETEALSVTGSMDVDDLESGLDTPKASMRPSFLDKATLSSQTDEWVRVSNFDVGTPTSQTGEDGDASSSSRRSLDRLAEWETVSGEQIPQRQEGQINSLEEEPSEVEAASGHSSESFTHLPSPTHLPEGVGAKDHSSDSSNRVQRRGKSNRSSSSSSSSSSSEEKPAPPSPDTGEVSSALPPALSVEEDQEVKRSNDTPVEKEVVVHEAPDIAGPASSEESPPASDYPSHPFREVLISSSAKDISEVKSPLTIVPRAEEESTAQVGKEVLPVQAEEGGGDKKSHSSVVTEGSKNNEEHMSYSSVVKEGSKGTNEEEREGNLLFSLAVSALGLEEEAPTSSTPVGVENKQVDADERASITIGEDKEVVGAASTSADAEEGEKSKDFEQATLVEKNSADQEGVGAHSGSEKALPTSGTSESVVAPASSAPVEKNGTGKPLLEVKPLSGGCCGVLYWLLRWDH